MPFLEPPTEATPAPSLQDPWDWTVDQVVFNLTNPNSPLLISNPSLSLPEYRAFADTLRDNDVTGLALLTEVNTQSLRDELGVRSFGHRASINLLIRQLQEQSREFHEQFQDSSRPSSARLAPRIGSRSPVTWEPQATSRFSELWHSPLTSAGSLQHRFGIDAIAASVQEQAGGQQRNILIEGPELPRHHLPERLSPGVGSEEKKGKDLHINEMKGGHDAGSPEDTNHSTCNGSSGNMASGLHSEDTSVVGEPGCNVRPGETAIIDETGKRRRRLALVLPDRSESERAPGARTWVSEDSGKPPKTVKKRISADVSFESTTVVDTCSPFSPNEDSVELHEHAADLETETSPPNNAVDSLAALAEPGAVLIDEKGRKRMRPTLLTKPEQDIEYHDGLQGHGEELTGATASHNGMLTNADPAAALKKLKHGRRVERSTDEIYLGHEPMAVDDLIYGDTALEKQVVDNEPDQPDDFVLCPDNNASSGQRIYINARIKYFLNSAILSLEREGHDYIGILPYPSRIGKKHHPLSITLFSKSAGGITASRSNRSKWIKDNSQQDPSTSDEKMSNVFNVVDPALAHDESEDPDWKALEKWKYLEGKDDVLPVYGDSDSEGEYDLETWREMEDEQGKILRSEGRCKSQKLTIEEVEVAIDDALAQIIKEWTLKEWPRLQLRAWRLWAKSRRNGNANAQVSLFTQEIGSLINRIAELREEISAEDWSKTSELRKQCKILQPSIFDLQDRKWKIATLKLREAPEKPPPTARRLRVTMPEVPDQELKEGEENIDTDAEIWESSHDSLDDFVVDDEANAGDILERTLNDDNVTMADGEDTMDSDTMVAAGDDLLVTPKCEKEAVLAKLDLGSSIFDRKPAAKQSPSIIIDLTQQSDPIEPKTPPPKPNRSFAIRTPPIYDSEDDSEIFERIQRSRSIKPVFRVPSIASPTVTVIDLESDSCDAMATPGSPIRTVLPDLKDFEGIKSMDTSRLEERQDRKRVLIWMIAHALGWRRNAAYCYLKNISIEASRMIVREGLTRLLGNHQVLKNMNNGDSDSVMQIATWQVCWTIPVIVKPDRGLSISHIKTTLDDEDCYDEFYDFLLECLRHYEKPSGSTSLITPRKKRQLIQPEDSSSELGHSALRKRKYFVPESQETLEKRQAARQRVADDDERRRREELKSRLSTMGSKEKDPLEVIVNPGKREDEEFIHLNPAFGNGAHMKPHQKEGLQFMWREITGDHQNLQGCLLAHAQGLGKTMQVISVLVTISEAAKSRSENIRQQIPVELREPRFLILCPASLVENWWDELFLWPPVMSTSIGPIRKVSSAILHGQRLTEIRSWNEEGGVLLLGYDTFRDLIHNKPRANRAAALDVDEHEDIKKALLDRPNLVVADEAHQFKNRAKALNRAMSQFRTTSRIALTGTPLSNDLGEYYSVIDWIAPDYLGTPAEFKATYEEPIHDGLYQDSTNSQYRVSRKILKALELELEPKVHRAGVARLHAELKGKMEFVVRVPLTKLQESLYRIYAESMISASRGGEPRSATLWSWLNILQLLCNHPESFRKSLLIIQAELVGHAKPDPKKPQNAVADNELPGSGEDLALLDEPVSQAGLSRIISDTQKVFDDLTTPLNSLSHSNKMQILMNILIFSQAANDKVLVFSHRIPTLNYVALQLEKLGMSYARIDGKLLPQKRQPITKEFNDGQTNVCLVSTRAGGTGLNLFGANRVVILDENFNPSWEQQAIGRAYRIGQQKTVYVYRLTVGGTFEQTIQNQAIFKEQLATRVVDKRNPSRGALKGSGQYLFLPKTLDREDLDPFLGNDPLVLDRLIADQTKNDIISITPSDIFHVDDGVELTAQEKEEAEQMQQDERLRRRNPKAYNDLMEKRREKARTQYTCPADYSASTTPSIQHVHWGNGPLIASRDMILPPSTDPNLGAMVGGIGQHYPYPIVATARASIPPLILPYEKTPLVDKSATSSLSTPEEHSRTESIPPSVLSRANPLPKSLPESTIPLLKGDDAKTREALGVAIDDLFELTETSRDDVSAGREHISKILVKAESKDIYNIMLKKEMENKYVIGSDTLRKTYSHELRRYIRERARNDADYERLAKGVKRLLEEDFTDPQTLVHVIADRLGIANAKSSSHQNGEHPNDPQAQPETCVSTNGGTEAVQGRSNGPKNQKEARKHSLPPEEQRSGKKLKRPSIITPDSSSAIAMDVQFENLMERESKRY